MCQFAILDQVQEGLMNTEDKIKELEKQLELKKAFLDVRVSFGKGRKYSKEVQDKVNQYVKEACTKAAEGSETTSKGFSEEEISILKKMVTSIKEKANQPTTVSVSAEASTMSNTVSDTLKKINSQNQALILTLDNIDRTIRNRIQPQSVVRVIGKRDENLAFVENSQGVRFNIPFDDLDFNTQQ